VPELLAADVETKADIVTLDAGHCPNWSQPGKVIDLLAGSPEAEESIAEHEAVARAINDQDPDAAETAMRDHIALALDHAIRELAWLR